MPRRPVGITFSYVVLPGAWGYTDLLAISDRGMYRSVVARCMMERFGMVDKAQCGACLDRVALSKARHVTDRANCVRALWGGPEGLGTCLIPASNDVV